MTTISFDIFCFGINRRVTTCWWLIGRSENTKSLLNASDCVSGPFFFEISVAVLSWYIDV